LEYDIPKCHTIIVVLFDDANNDDRLATREAEHYINLTAGTTNYMYNHELSTFLSHNCINIAHIFNNSPKCHTIIVVLFDDANNDDRLATREAEHYINLTGGTTNYNHELSTLLSHNCINIAHI
jgi:hypothetical protein